MEGQEQTTNGQKYSIGEIPANCLKATSTSQRDQDGRASNFHRTQIDHGDIEPKSIT